MMGVVRDKGPAQVEVTLWPEGVGGIEGRVAHADAPEPAAKLVQILRFHRKTGSEGADRTG